MKNGTKKVISALVGVTAGLVTGGVAAKSISSKKISDMEVSAAKVHQLYMAFDQWLRIHQEGKTLVSYFERNAYKTVAIYGMKELGERLFDELEGSGIEVCYVIDKNADTIYADVDIVKPEEELRSVDVIVVTALYYFDEISELLDEKVDCPVVSLEDILYEV